MKSFVCVGAMAILLACPVGPAAALDINQNNRMIMWQNENDRMRAQANARSQSYQRQLDSRTRAQKRADERAAHALACAVFGCGPTRKAKRQTVREPRADHATRSVAGRQMSRHNSQGQPERFLPIRDHGGALPAPPVNARPQDRFMPVY
jgi:hypothetical protein